MKPNYRKLKTGDILITTSEIPFIEHFGVVVVEGATTCIYHCTPERNVTCDTLMEFLANRELITIRATNTPSDQIYERFQAIRYRKYNALIFNCVHLAEYLTRQSI